ncbi:MAG: PIN domain-containing protein [Acidobacteria bacterium]|nr:MAG: PIN domain-containing protein [Acidobacteriota bacterium]
MSFISGASPPQQRADDPGDLARFFRGICYLRPHGWKDLKKAVQQALSDVKVSTCWVVKAEVLIGARDDAAFARLSDNLRVIPEVPVTAEVWATAARLGYALRRQGFMVPLPDLLIAQVAIEGGLVLWHADKHFEQIRHFSSLQARNFLPE